MLTVEPEIVERYVRAGQVRLVFRDVLNHGERSRRASEAAACAGRQGYFWHMHEILFTEQDRLYATSEAGQAELMQSLAAGLDGLDQAEFATCLTERQTLAALQAADAEQRQRGIVYQPIFEIGEKRLAGLQSIEAMGAAIEAAVAETNP